jgi:hypothetical protein
MDLKATVVAKEGVANIGNDVIELNDKTQGTFMTRCLKTFVVFVLSFLKNNIPAKPDIRAIFFGLDNVQFKSTCPEYNELAFARCDLEKSVWLEQISKIVGRSISLEALDEFLFTMKDFYSGAEAKDLYDRIQKLSVKKILNLCREKDRAGNYSYMVEFKDGAGGAEFPAKIGFHVPVIEGIPDTREFSFDLFVSYISNEEKPSITFSLKNPAFEEEVKYHIKTIVSSEITPLTEKMGAFYGSFNVTNITDEWRHKINKIG